MDLFHRLLYSDGFDGIFGITDASSIDNAKMYALNIQNFFDGIASGTGDITDDGSLFIEQSIEQRGFPGIGTTGNDGVYAMFDGVPQTERID